MSTSAYSETERQNSQFRMAVEGKHNLKEQIRIKLKFYHVAGL